MVNKVIRICPNCKLQWSERTARETYTDSNADINVGFKEYKAKSFIGHQFIAGRCPRCGQVLDIDLEEQKEEKVIDLIETGFIK